MGSKFSKRDGEEIGKTSTKNKITPQIPGKEEYRISPKCDSWKDELKRGIGGGDGEDENIFYSTTDLYPRLLQLWESVTVLCFVVSYIMSLLVLQSSWWGRRELVVLLGLSPWCLVIVVCFSSRCYGFVYSLWLWYFLVILAYYFCISNIICNSVKYKMKFKGLWLWCSTMPNVTTLFTKSSQEMKLAFIFFAATLDLVIAYFLILTIESCHTHLSVIAPNNAAIFSTKHTRSTSSQAKGTNSTLFLTCVRNEVELVPLACEDDPIQYDNIPVLALKHRQRLQN